MKTDRLKIHCQKGLHVRAIDDLVQIAKEYDCKVYITKTERSEVREILKILRQNIKYMDEIFLEVEGEQENLCFTSLQKLLNIN